MISPLFTLVFRSHKTISRWGRLLFLFSVSNLIWRSLLSFFVVTFSICLNFKGWLQIFFSAAVEYEFELWPLLVQLSAGKLAADIGKLNQSWNYFYIGWDVEARDCEKRWNVGWRQNIWSRLCCVMYFFFHRTCLYCLQVFISAAWHYESCHER